MLDTGSHYYDAYETSDGKYISLGSIEPQFYAEFLELTGLGDQLTSEQNNREAWPETRTDRSAEPSAREAPQGFRRGGGHRAAGSGATLQPHGERGPGTAGARRAAQRRSAE